MNHHQFNRLKPNDPRPSVRECTECTGRFSAEIVLLGLADMAAPCDREWVLRRRGTR